MRIVLTDARHAEHKRDELVYDGGVEAFVRYLDRTKPALIEAPIVLRQERDGIGVEVALWWNDSYHENVLCFTNNIPQRDGGTHLAGSGRAHPADHRLRRIERGDEARKSLADRDDCREGLTAVVSVKVPDPKFSSQTKDKLVSSEVRPAVEGVLNETLGRWLEEHPSEARTIAAKVALAAAAREAARKARDLTTRKGDPRPRLAARQARRLPRSATRRNARSCWSRAIRPAARPSRAVTERSKLFCRCAEKSSTSSGRGSTRCCRARRSAR